MSKKEQSAKLKALELTLGKLEKTYGKGVVMKLGDKIIEDIASIPTGSINLDLALGVGGYPRGRVVEIFGPVFKNFLLKRFKALAVPTPLSSF